MALEASSLQAVTHETKGMNTSADSAELAGTALRPCTQWELVKYFLYLGTLGFGGPIALAGYMQRDVVERRQWISREDYLQGLALAQLAPGPLAAQLAIYIGWVRGRVVGASLVGLAFVLPSFLMVLSLAALYVRFGGMAWMRGVFYGVGASVIAIVFRSVVKLGKLTLAKDPLLWGLFAISAVVTAWTEKEIIWLFAAGGVVTLLVKAPPKRSSSSRVTALAPLWFLTGIHGVAPLSVLLTVAGYFAAAGAFVFGSGLAIVPFLHGGVVTQYHWLNDQQFLDAVAVAMITPGPVVITVAFIGYLVAGPLGATVAALATFVPCYLFTVLPAPYFRRFAKNSQIAAFVVGVTASATGAIAGAGFVLGRRALFDTPTVLICLVTLFVVTKFKKVQEPAVIVVSGLLGLILFTLRH